MPAVSSIRRSPRLGPVLTGCVKTTSDRGLEKDDAQSRGDGSARAKVKKFFYQLGSISLCRSSCDPCPLSQSVSLRLWVLHHPVPSPDTLHGFFQYSTCFSFVKISNINYTWSKYFVSYFICTEWSSAIRETPSDSYLCAHTWWTTFGDLEPADLEKHIVVHNQLEWRSIRRPDKRCR